MRNCQVRINMNYDVYIEGNEPVRLLSDMTNEIYFTEEYTVLTLHERMHTSVSLFLRQFSSLRTFCKYLAKIVANSPKQLFD